MKKLKIVCIVFLSLISPLIHGDQAYEFNKPLAGDAKLLYSINTGENNFYFDGIVFKNNAYFIALKEKETETYYYLYRINPETANLSSAALGTKYKIEKKVFFIKPITEPLSIKTRLVSYSGISKVGDLLTFTFIKKKFSGKKIVLNTEGLNLFNFIKISDFLVLLISVNENNLNFLVLTHLLEKPVRQFSTEIDEKNLLPFRACYFNGYLYLLFNNKDEEKSVMYLLDIARWEKLKKIREFNSFFSLYPATSASGQVIVGLDNKIVLIADPKQVDKDIKKEFKDKLKKKGNILVDKNGEIFLTLQSGVAKLDKDLGSKWNFPTAGEPSRVVSGDDGVFYFGDSQGTVYALNEQGKEIFKEKIQTVKSKKELTADPQPFTAAPILIGHYLVMTSKNQVNVFRVSSQGAGGSLTD